MPSLPELDARGYRYYFQYTLTGYPRMIQAAVPPPRASIKTFSGLSERIGSDNVVWRYDPVLVSNQVAVAEHGRLFAKIGRPAGGQNRVRGNQVALLRLCPN